jgi:hypothetical protein
MAGLTDSVGVCGTQKSKGVQVDASVGIDVNLNAGNVNEAPSFEKELFNTYWPLYSTCIGVGDDIVKPTEPPTSVGPIQTGSTGTITRGPLVTGTGIALVTGTGTISGGLPMMTGNSTVLRLAQRRPTALYNF